jgi:hypothetical protein
MLHPSLLSWCYVFVFGCAHNNLFASLCFRSFFYLFFVVHIVMLMLHRVLKVFAIVVCLWIFHSTSLTTSCYFVVL